MYCMFQMLESSGYTDIKLEDWSDRYLLYLQQNLTRLRKVMPNSERELVM